MMFTLGYLMRQVLVALSSELIQTLRVNRRSPVCERVAMAALLSVGEARLIHGRFTCRLTRLMARRRVRMKRLATR